MAAITRIGRALLAAFLGVITLGATARRDPSVSAEYGPLEAIGYESAVAFVPPPEDKA